MRKRIKKGLVATQYPGKRRAIFTPKNSSVHGVCKKYFTKVFGEDFEVSASMLPELQSKGISYWVVSI